MNTPVHRKPAKDSDKHAREEDTDGSADDDDEDDEDSVDVTDEVGEERLMAFLNDPVKSMQIFLSSYMRERGLIW